MPKRGAWIRAHRYARPRVETRRSAGAAPDRRLQLAATAHAARRGKPTGRAVRWYCPYPGSSGARWAQALRALRQQSGARTLAEARRESWGSNRCARYCKRALADLDIVAGADQIVPFHHRHHPGPRPGAPRPCGAGGNGADAWIPFGFRRARHRRSPRRARRGRSRGSPRPGAGPAGTDRASGKAEAVHP